MFGITTTETISNELLHNYSAWDKYVAHLWYCFFNFCDINPNATVVEIAPGASPKIAMALKKADFCGQVFIVEPYQNALTLITQRYKDYLPQATVYPIAKSLAECLDFLPQSPDFLVSHHALDDMMIARNLSSTELLNLFNWVKDTQLVVQQQFQQRWLQLQADSQQLSNIQNAVIQDWSTLLNQLKPKVAILSQYPSLVLNDYAMESLNQAAQTLLCRLKHHYQQHLIATHQVQTLLNANKNYNYPLIAHEVLNAKNWMLYSDD